MTFLKQLGSANTRDITLLYILRYNKNKMRHYNTYYL